MELGFSSYDADDFLLFYGALIVAAMVAGFWIPGFLRPDGREQQLHDPDELAYLAGGKQRFVDSVVAALFARGALRADGKRLFKGSRVEGESRAERDLLRHAGDLTLSDAAKQLDDHAHAVDRDLVSKGLLIARGARTKLRLLPLVPYLLVLAIGIYRRQAGVAEGEPVGYLTIMIFIAFMIGLVRLFKSNPRTRAGDTALDQATINAQRLRGTPTSGEAGLAVGLFGTGVLVGTPYVPLHFMRHWRGGDGGAAADGGDGGDGGGGCGGGGCGGCGG
ncbi:TIGR04222 domain-containing membrane protein [Aurantiacibacter gilvus]|uniref:TIGR04222 domain-containing membrane protein n=1 Tax=Aurantiacibacter gilvus TaxID=3139141 RepID=A0ABU9IEA9_9SPHN